MKALRLHRIHDLGLDEIPVPEPGPGEVLIRVEAAGICGTDRHLFKGEFPCEAAGDARPRVRRHRGRPRRRASRSPTGARVTCDPNDWCGACDACRRGRVNLCANNVATGIHRDGGFAEYAVFPARRASPCRPTLDPLHGAFCEPLACTLHGVDIGAPRPGERVLVIGGGVIGLLALQLACARRRRGDAADPPPRQARAGHDRSAPPRRPRRPTRPAHLARGRRPDPRMRRRPGDRRRGPVADPRRAAAIVVLGVLRTGRRRCRSSRSTCCSARSSCISPSSTPSPRRAPPS